MDVVRRVADVMRLREPVRALQPFSSGGRVAVELGVETCAVPLGGLPVC